MKKPAPETEISHKLSKLCIKPAGHPMSDIISNKENAPANRKLFKVQSKPAESSLKDIAKMSEEGLSAMKEEMRASRFQLLNDFIVNYYLSQGELKYVPKEWKKHYLRTVVRGIIRFAVNYDIEEKQVLDAVTHFVTLHGLPANKSQIEQFILLNSY